MVLCIVYITAAVVFIGLTALITGIFVFFLAPRERITSKQDVMMRSFGAMALVAAMLISSTGQSLLMSLGGISLSFISSFQPCDANADVNLLLQKFKSSLPNRVNLENIDDKYAYNCFLTGLGSGINRDGDAAVEFAENKAIFSFGLSTNEITVECKWRKKITFVKMSGTVKAYTERVSIRARLSMDLAPGAQPVLEEFKVTHLHKIKTKVRGAGIMNWIGKEILNRKVNGARDKIIREVEQNLSKLIRRNLDQLKLPTL